jgi:HNH endonuclease/NUMOD4 motif
VEEFRDIPGYEGFYQISDEGNVISLVRLTPDAIARGVRKAKQSLAFGKNRQGRLQVTLCKEGFTKRFQVHTLVLLTFVGPCPEGMECRHLDGNHLNNRLGNLEWATHEVNMRDKQRHGTEVRGEDHFKAKLTEVDVRQIRASTATERELAFTYAVSQVAIHYIRTRKTWKHVQ